MADFVAVLKKTLHGMGETTPEMRAQVYDKARGTIAAKLATLNPPLHAAGANRQKQVLEEAIASVEAEFTAKSVEDDPLAEMENVFSSIDRNKSQPVYTSHKLDSEVRSPMMPVALAPVVRPDKIEPTLLTCKPALTYASQALDPLSNFGADVDEDNRPVLPANDDQVEAAIDNNIDPFQATRQKPHKRIGGGLITVTLVATVLGVGGYALWSNCDAFMGLSTGKPEEKQASAKEATTPAPTNNTQTVQATVNGKEKKFSQRMTANGNEVESDTAAGSNGVGEGTSVAPLTQLQTPASMTAMPKTFPVAPAKPGTSLATGETTLPTSENSLIAVGQKAIFYEERTNVAQGSAELGSVVWTVVQESPGGDLPPEPAIRAEVTIPGKDIQLRMTIRRNADKTLPASHILELIFLIPPGFAGGGIENILRVTLKSSEQDAGSPLFGIPAKIADGFFLVALNNNKAEVDANLNLLRRQSWIDVPVIYKSGRRALFAMEKGIHSNKIFEETMNAWQTKTAD